MTQSNNIRKELPLGSSETTREPTLHTNTTNINKNIFDFDDYLNNYQPSHLANIQKTSSIHFLEWFVGFTEGDGSFGSKIQDNRPRLSFEISQKDPKLLFKIKKSLGFGFVRAFNDKGFFRFTVEDKKGIERLQVLFNGNLILPKVQNRYLNWLKSKTFKEGFITKPFDKSPSLETAWLLGFIEAEGCFSCSLGNLSERSIQNFSLKQKFTLKQKDVNGEYEVLNQIGNLFALSHKPLKDKNNQCTLEVHSIPSQKILIDYLCRFGLKGQKKIEAFRWYRIYLLRSKQTNYDMLNRNKLLRLISSLKKV